MPAARCEWWFGLVFGCLGISASLTAQAQPVAVDDSYDTRAPQGLTVDADDGVLANDSAGQAGDEGLEAELVSTTANGTLLLAVDGGFSYTPTVGFTGNDTFTYRAVNGAELSNVATVTIRVASEPGNASPVAATDSYSTSEGSELLVNAPGVLANDSDPEGASLTAVLVDDVADGTLALNANGSFRYTPRTGFSGTDTFRYQARDASASSQPATVTISVAEVNGPPTAVADSYATTENGTLNVNPANGVLDNDTDPEGDNLTAVLVDGASSGTVTLNANGSFGYVPAPGFAGTVTFSYQADDGTARSGTATVTITVSAGNGPPMAQGDSYATDEGQALNVNAVNGVLANDTDPDDDDLTAVLVTTASSGTVTLGANGSFSFVPAPGFAGTATFTYQADDGTARSNVATVTITVNAGNDAPTAQPDSYTTAEDTLLSVGGRGVLGNDTDANGDALTAERVTNVASGTLQLDESGTFTYRPPSNFTGTVSFTYRARDASTASAAVPVTIAVSPVNDAPFITNAPDRTATEGGAYRYALAASDPDGDPVTIAAPTLPSWLTFTPPATISGTPDEADVGNHDVTMTVSDGTAAPVELRFRIAVTSVDDAPSIKAIPGQTATEGSPLDFNLAEFVTDDDTPAGELEYAATRALPRGLALSADGRLTGTPAVGDSVGTHTVAFTVADGTTTVPGEMRLVVLAAGRVDLEAAISVAPTPVTLEAPATWTLTVLNRAAQVEANGVSLGAVFVGEVPIRFDALTTSGCTITPSGNENRLSCTLGPLAGNASTSVTLTGRGSFAGDVFAEATVAVAPGGALDDVSGNDRAEASLSIAQRIAGAPAQSITLAGAAVAAGDFDADGFDDLAVATSSSQGLVVFMNIADPANPSRRMFAAPPLALGGEGLASDVAASDLDRDGDLDIVTSARNGAPNRAFLNTSGGFTSSSLGDASADSHAVAAGDVNGDAFVDLVLASSGMSTVLINSGAGAVFRRGPSVGPHVARDALLVNLLGDALPELVIADGDGDAAVYSNTGGVFTLATRLSTGPTSAVATGDFNGDGRADLVFARDTADPPAVPSALVWLTTANPGNAFFVADELGAAATTDLLVNDFNLDTRADVLAASGYGARVFTNAGAANGTFGLHPQQLATTGARGVAMGKFNGDDRVDLAVVGDTVAVFFNDGKGNLGPADSTPPVIQLRGASTINVTIDATYSDPGATASDAEDGDITSRIAVTNPVDTTVLGTYTITYAVSDLAGNAAVPVTRTVNVQPQPDAQGGGGGALGAGALALLLAAMLSRLKRRLVPDERSYRHSSNMGTAISPSTSAIPITASATRNGCVRSTSAKVCAVPSRSAAARSARTRAWRSR
jgi:VCBS repeat-containing protein